MKPEEMTPSDLASALRTASKHASKYCTQLMEGGARVIESQAARIAELEGVVERLAKSHVPGFWYGPLDVVEGPHPSVKSIVDTGSGDALIAYVYHDNLRCAGSIRDLMIQAAEATHKIKSKGSQRLDVNIWPDKDTGGFHQ